jgi:hypothetical protein
METRPGNARKLKRRFERLSVKKRSQSLVYVKNAFVFSRKKSRFASRLSAF